MCSYTYSHRTTYDARTKYAQPLQGCAKVWDGMHDMYAPYMYVRGTYPIHTYLHSTAYGCAYIRTVRRSMGWDLLHPHTGTARRAVHILRTATVGGVVRYYTLSLHAG